MDGGITKVRCDGISAVDRMNALEVERYFIKSFVPPETLPTMVSAAHRISKPVFIVVQILQGDGLRADVPAAERVVLVTADVQPVSSFEFRVSSFDLLRPSAAAVCLCLNRNRNAANRFAEIAVAVMNLIGGLHSAAITKFGSEVSSTTR
jgi:hypothetical protein